MPIVQTNADEGGGSSTTARSDSSGGIYENPQGVKQRPTPGWRLEVVGHESIPLKVLRKVRPFKVEGDVIHPSPYAELHIPEVPLPRSLYIQRVQGLPLSALFSTYSSLASDFIVLEGPFVLIHATHQPWEPMIRNVVLIRMGELPANEDHERILGEAVERALQTYRSS